MPGKLISRLTILMFVVLAAAAIDAAPRSAQAETHVAVSFFYDELAADGYWVEHARYGTVWYPRHTPADWEPYVYGRWVWTTDYGWYWDSDENWGWATYHYGRWVYTDTYRWVWVPDDEWGPAWVEWRTGGGNVGWTPMPPEVAWRDGGFVYAGVDLSAPRYRRHWIFVAEADFSKADPWRYRAPRARTGAMIAASEQATSYARVDARIVNRSVDVARISAAGKVRISPVAVETSTTRVYGRATTHGGARVMVYRPRVAARTGLQLDMPPIGSRIETDTSSELPPVETRSGRESIESEVGTDIGVRGGGISGGSGIGIGGGQIGIGGGGGLRIGR